MTQAKDPAWAKRWAKQYVMGDSPPPPLPTWSSLKVALDCLYGAAGGWNRLHPGAKRAHCERMQRDFDDETKQIEWCFNKLGHLLTAIGIAVAVGGAIAGTHLKFKTPVLMAIAGSLLVLALLLDGWALSARLKIFRRPSDSALKALAVSSGNRRNSHDQVIIDPIDADVWYLYQWSCHRARMHNAIEKLFTESWICLALAVILAVIGLFA